MTEKGVRKMVKAPYVLGSHVAIARNLKNTTDAIGAIVSPKTSNNPGNRLDPFVA